MRVIRDLVTFVVACAFLTGLVYFAIGGLVFLIPLMMIPVGFGVWITISILGLHRDYSGLEEEDDDLPSGRGD
ncbi:MAG TPA: hypothetical protein VI643_05095 [Planctomycetota bacterium]|nr:hypothetical protein [Planctomycetota bacterium]